MSVLPRRRPNVGKLSRKGKVERLREAVGYHESVLDGDGVEWDVGAPVRVEAAKALAGFEGSAVEEGLAEALSDKHHAVRLAAVEGIARRGVPTGVEELLDGVVAWTGPPDLEASALALETLVRWRIEGLAGSLAERLLAPGAPPLVDAHLDAFSRLLAADPNGAPAAAPVAERLLGVLHVAADPDHADRAERLLERLGSGAVDPLLMAVEDGRATPGAVRAAGLLRDSRAVEPLIRLLRDPDAALRESAAAALGGLNDTRAVPALVSCTQDPDQSVRDSASQALERMGPAAVIVALVTLLGPREGQLSPSEEGGPEQLQEAVTQLLGRGNGAHEQAPEPVAVERSPQPTRPATRRSRILGVLQSALDPHGQLPQ